MRNFSDFFPDWQWDVDVRRDAGASPTASPSTTATASPSSAPTRFDSNLNGGPYGDRVRRISARRRAAASRSTSTICSTPPAIASSAILRPQPRRPRARRQRIPRAQPPPQLRADAQAQLRRRRQRGGEVARLKPLESARDFTSIARRNTPWASPKSCRSTGQDPFDLDHQLTDEERLVRDTAEGYAQDKLLPRVTERLSRRAFRPRDPDAKWASSACSARPSRTNMAAPASAMSATA